MSDPAEKSDDLIAELARLMAASTPPGPQPAPEPPARAPAAPPVRIPGMEPPRAAEAAATPRAPVTGAIRIPGMDSPAPVATSAPVAKFDFGKPVAAAPIRQEPLSSLAERLAPHDPVPPAARVEPNPGPTPAPTPQPTPIRVPAALKPVTENRSFGQGPALAITPPPSPVSPALAAPPASGGSDFSFDFGFGKAPPPSASPPRPTTPPADDPIAELIAAELDGAAAAPPPPAREDKPRPAPGIIAGAAAKPATGAPPPLRPVTVAPRVAETDRFAVSPDSGLDMKSAPPSVPPKAPPPGNSDPMSEIESLIGEAVRVELSAPGPLKVQTAQARVEPQLAVDAAMDHGEAPEPAHRPEPAPVVPPLTGQFAPRRSSLKDEAGASGAEDAILAAAAASGARVDRLDPSIGNESPYRRLKVKPARSGFLAGGSRQYVGMAVAATLLLAAGLGLYWVFNIGRGQLASGENAPQLTADTTPVKEIPAAAPAAETARSPVLEQIDGTSAGPGVEQLVSTDETKGAPVVVAREVTPTTAGDGDSGLANRKVRTVTVRPDGTIVSGDDAVAGAEELPVERPNVPAVPATDTPNLLIEPTPVATTEPAGTLPAVGVAPPAASQGGPVLDSTIVAPIPMSFPAHETAAAASTTAAATPVLGARTPNGQIDLLGGSKPVVQTPVAAAAPADAGNAAAYVQLSSSPSESDAQASLRAMSNRYGSLFGGNALSIQAANLGQKGTWYRVRLPAPSLGEAQRICANIKANGGDCIVTGG